MTSLSGSNYCLTIFSDVADIKSYVLISQLPDEVYKKYVKDVNSSPMAGFTFTVVSIIHLAGGKLPEGNVSCFSNLGICLIRILRLYKLGVVIVISFRVLVNPDLAVGHYFQFARLHVMQTRILNQLVQIYFVLLF